MKCGGKIVSPPRINILNFFGTGLFSEENVIIKMKNLK
jgi:hypothetical protein